MRRNLNPQMSPECHAKAQSRKGWQHRELCGSWLASDVAGTFNIFLA
jgi:hypothetical protein